MIHNFNADSFDSLYPKYKGGRPRTFSLPERREIKKIVKSRPTEHGLPFSTWSLAKLLQEAVVSHAVIGSPADVWPVRVGRVWCRRALLLAGVRRRYREPMGFWQYLVDAFAWPAWLLVLIPAPVAMVAGYRNAYAERLPAALGWGGWAGLGWLLCYR